MMVELIPALEIGFHNHLVPAPSKFPSWDYPAEWDAYAAQSHREAGFPDPLQPFTPGLFFYRASDITLGNLRKLTASHLEGYFAGDYDLLGLCSFFGGYVLRVDDHNALFPQCCGELSDIIYWKYLAKYGRPAYYQGHPAPQVSFTAEEVVFTCLDDDKPFGMPTQPKIRVNKLALSAAYDQALLELAVFARKVEQVQQELNLPVDNIAHLLVYRNVELPGEQP
ncbi:hypothetical protein LRS06_16645 [Hymenobacter sp. J193]|uniref:hypothetical protein n=1 Tax=Hymenobacter sp. J193 TaxID=2898429 RepID=UPI002150E651|nr:hypothetical protein [Hymenobacter sp. J193]MCR5889366.1 hypothetical protein [Hymenobacter sp. J193]